MSKAAARFCRLASAVKLNSIHLASFWRVVDSFLHDSVVGDSQNIAEHRQFVASHLCAGLVALMAIPIVLVFAQSARLPEIGMLLWLASPLITVAYISRTGNLENAHLLSAAGFVGFVSWLALLTGGASSVHLVWLVVVPLEAAMTGRRALMLKSICLAIVAFGVVLFCTATSLLPAFSNMLLRGEDAIAISLIAALVYSASLALRIDTVHKASVNTVRLEEERYRLLADHVSDVITRHGKSGDTTYVSSAAARVFSISPDELIGDGFFQIVHIADRPAYLMALSRALADGEHTSVEFRIKKGQFPNSASVPEEKFIWVEMRCCPTLNLCDSGRVHEGDVVSVTRDISKRKQQEHELEAAHREAENASVAKTRFLTNVTHELRTPLNTIIGFSELMSTDIIAELSKDRYKEYSLLIKQSGEHLLTLVNALLDMSRIEAGQFDIIPEPFDAKQAIVTSCKMIETSAMKAEVSVVEDIQPTVGEITSDSRALRQIMLNLLSNAVKFTDAGGTITVSARQTSTWFHIQVRDDGIGIESDIISKLGTPFVQADSSLRRNHEGAGIGLSVVKGLCELQGGKMEIQSELGIGTTVSISLPVLVSVEPELNESYDQHDIRGAA